MNTLNRSPARDMVVDPAKHWVKVAGNKIPTNAVHHLTATMYQSPTVHGLSAVRTVKNGVQSAHRLLNAVGHMAVLTENASRRCE